MDTASIDTSFKGRLDEFAREHRLPIDRPLAPVTFTVHELRVVLLHFFSCGAVHQVAMHRRLEELLPEDRPRVGGT